MKILWLIPVALALTAAILLAERYSDVTNKSPAVSNQSATQSTDTADSALDTMPWRYGVAQRYQLLSDSSMQMQASTPGASSIRVHMQGQLDTLTLKTDNDTAVVGMRLSSVELKINDVTDHTTNHALTSPFRVHFSASGIPLIFEFPAEVNQQNRSILQNLVRSFRSALIMVTPG